MSYQTLRVLYRLVNFLVIFHVRYSPCLVAGGFLSHCPSLSRVYGVNGLEVVLSCFRHLTLRVVPP